MQKQNVYQGKTKWPIHSNLRLFEDFSQLLVTAQSVEGF